MNISGNIKKICSSKYIFIDADLKGDKKVEKISQILHGHIFEKNDFKIQHGFDL